MDISNYVPIINVIVFVLLSIFLDEVCIYWILFLKFIIDRLPYPCLSRSKNLLFILDLNR